MIVKLAAPTLPLASCTTTMYVPKGRLGTVNVHPAGRCPLLAVVPFANVTELPLNVAVRAEVCAQPPPVVDKVTVAAA